MQWLALVLSAITKTTVNLSSRHVVDILAFYLTIVVFLTTVTSLQYQVLAGQKE